MAAADPAGDSFANTGREAALIENTSGVSALLVTFITQQQVDGEDVTDKQVSIGIGETHLIGPFPKAIYDDANGAVQMTYSDATAANVAIVRIA